MNAPAFQLTPSPPPEPIKHRQQYCDARCMYARGPDCTCKCNGLNHGRGIFDTNSLDMFTNPEK